MLTNTLPPALAKRLDFDEQELRNSLYKYTLNPQVKDPAYRAFLPAIGGTTVYLFGDPKKLTDLSTEVAVRVHDEVRPFALRPSSRPVLTFSTLLASSVQWF